MNADQKVADAVGRLGSPGLFGLRPPAPPGVEDYLVAILGIAVGAAFTVILVHAIAAMSPRAIAPYAAAGAFLMILLGFGVPDRFSIGDRLLIVPSALVLGLAAAYPAWIWKRRSLEKRGLVGFDPAGVESPATRSVTYGRNGASPASRAKAASASEPKPSLDAGTSSPSKRGSRVREELTRYQRGQASDL